MFHSSRLRLQMVLKQLDTQLYCISPGEDVFWGIWYVFNVDLFDGVVIC